jgi:hypothetical protein
MPELPVDKVSDHEGSDGYYLELYKIKCQAPRCLCM